MMSVPDTIRQGVKRSCIGHAASVRPPGHVKSNGTRLPVMTKIVTASAASQQMWLSDQSVGWLGIVNGCSRIGLTLPTADAASDPRTTCLEISSRAGGRPVT